MRDLGSLVVEQRDQQPSKARVVDVPNPRSHIAAYSPGGSARIGREVQQRSLGRIDILRQRAGGEGHGGGDTNARVGVGQQRPGQRGGVFIVDVADRHDRRGADAGVGIGQHPPDLWQPADCDVAAHRSDRPQRPPAHFGSLVMQQERCHQTSFVERLQHVNGVDDAGSVRLREFLHQRFDRREVGAGHAKICRLHFARFQASTETHAGTRGGRAMPGRSRGR